MKLAGLISLWLSFPFGLGNSGDQSKEQHRIALNKKRNKRSLRHGLHHKHIPSQSRIIGGKDASAGEYPFFVEWGGCGGSLIHEDIVLTAAHCNPTPTNNVIIGSRLFGNAKNGESRRITLRKPHHSYNDKTVAYDFMLLKLNRPVTNKQPALINNIGSTPVNGQALTVVGFGATKEQGGGPSERLQEVSINYISTNRCNKDISYRGEVKGDIMFCAGNMAGGKDSCQGDSGGPIFVEESDGRFTQMGIVSWGYGCARPNFPGVHARVSAVSGWIKRQICALSDNPPASCNTNDGNASNNDKDDNTNNIDEKKDSSVSSPIQVRLEITYDNFPSEESWSIKKGSRLIVEQPSGSLDQTGLVTRHVRLEPGVNYIFEIQDTHGDGICCQYGNGKYRIIAETSGGDVLLAESNGKFGEGETKKLIVPGGDGSPAPLSPTFSSSPGFPVCNICGKGSSVAKLSATVVLPGQPAVTCSDLATRSTAGFIDPMFCPIVVNLSSTVCCSNSAPPLAPGASQIPPPSTCVDSTSLFLVDDSAGNQNCSWLRMNKDRYGYLCGFVDVVAKCKETCGACSLLPTNK